jgi:hypothetical protein
VANDLDLLDGQFVVVHNLLPLDEGPLGKQYDMLHAINRHHLTVAVGLAAVVHEARGVALSAPPYVSAYLSTHEQHTLKQAIGDNKTTNSTNSMHACYTYIRILV